MQKQKKRKISELPASAASLLGLLLDLEDGDDIFLRTTTCSQSPGRFM
jgi:hypothetical protein